MVVFAMVATLIWPPGAGIAWILVGLATLVLPSIVFDANKKDSLAKLAEWQRKENERQKAYEEVLEASRKVEFQELIQSLEDASLDLALLPEKLQFIRERSYFSDIQGAAIYQASLDLVARNSANTTVKTFALDVGRWHHARIRPDGKVTSYDEAAMLNDISVRTL